MKIGILTYYRSHNYGAMLQSVALRKVIHEMGHETSFIDYWPQHQKNIYRLFEWENFWRGGIRGRIRYLKSFVKILIPKLMRRRNFNHFYHDHIAPYVSSQKDNYDVIVYGSDQIWRKQGWGYGYNPVYFGKNKLKAFRHISYAASMGNLPSKEDAPTVLNYLKNLDNISVRENSLSSFLLKHGFNDVVVSLDPTLLLSANVWAEYAGQERLIKEPYLLYYNLLSESFSEEEITKLAKKMNLHIIRLSVFASSYPSKDNRTTDGPYEFLNLVKNADFVCTSSYHGLVFSILFNRPFFCSFSVNSDRAESLLEKLSLSNRLLPPMSTFPESCDINWNSVMHTVNEAKTNSIAYLKEALSPFD